MPNKKIVGYIISINNKGLERYEWNLITIGKEELIAYSKRSLRDEEDREVSNSCLF